MAGENGAGPAGARAPARAGWSPAGLHVVHRNRDPASPSLPGGPGAVVLVHGVLDSARSFTRLARLLGGRRDVVAYDRRGYQRSRQQPVRLDGHVDDLVAVVEGVRRAAGARRVLAVGHSYGGVVVLAAAARHPSLLDGIVAYEPPLPWIDGWPVDRGADGDGDASTPLPAPGEDPAAFAARFTSTMLGSERYPRLSVAVRDGLALDGPAALAELGELGGQPAFDPAAVDTAVVVARGERAAPRHVLGASWLASHLPSVELAEVSGASHGAHLTHPGALAHLVEQLDARLEARPPSRSQAR